MENIEEPPKTTFEMVQEYTQDPTIKYLTQTLIAVFLVLLTLFTVVRPAIRYYTAGAKVVLVPGQQTANSLLLM